MSGWSLRVTAALCAAVFFSAQAGAAAAAEQAWGEHEIRASHVLRHAPDTLPAAPAFAADPLNLFLVTSGDDGGINVLDGDRVEPVHRFAWRARLLDGIRFSPDGRFAYLASQDGWVAKFDLWSFKLVAEVRAGVATREIALSADGRHLGVANAQPHALVLLDQSLRPLKVIEARDRAGRRSSRVAALRDAPRRRSLIAALPDLGELWEISYDPKAPEIADGLVHDYKLREGTFVPGYLNPRRTPLEQPVDALFTLADGRQVIGASETRTALQVIHLDVRRRIATLDLPGAPAVETTVGWMENGRSVLAVPILGEPVVSIVDAGSWKVLRAIRVPGPVRGVATHPARREVVVGIAAGDAHGGVLQRIDRHTLEVVEPSVPLPPGTSGDIESDRHGRTVLASIAGPGGSVIAYDASTGSEVKRLSIRNPVRKYNVFNHISR